MEFQYKVRTPEGEVREGSVEASSLESAITNLQKQNLIIVSVDPARKERSISSILNYSIERITAKDVVLVSRQLATLFEAKVPIVQALRTMSSEVTKEALRKHLMTILDDIQGGMSMSQAMSRHPQVFSSFYINMVKSGEESGKLGEVFLYLADYLERNYELRGKVKSALMYPAFVMLAFVAVMIIIITFVIPNIAVIFQEAA
ncbi:MAG: type II secretion system F family protein, partial [bacterium]|nr:type II secretion system F family protein [bacterium]